jgi:hypothetical protein
MSEPVIEPVQAAIAAEKPPESPEPAYRLCITVSVNPFMTILNPNAITGRCVRCPNPVWIDAAQEVPEIEGVLPFRPLCFPCALADPELKDSIRQWFPAAVIEYYTEGTTSVWKDGERMTPNPLKQEAADDDVRGDSQRTRGLEPDV